jgi:hypothetical protein
MYTIKKKDDDCYLIFERVFLSRWTRRARPT